MATIPTISFKNDLSFDVLVYDSFVPTDLTPDEDNYFGRLTQLGTAKANTTSAIQPIHSSTTFILDNATDRKPLKRCVKMSYHTEVTSFDIKQADADAMAATFKFIDLITKNPADALNVTFQKILKDPSLTVATLAPAVNDFFKQQPDYATCVYEDFMMGITYAAQNPAPVTTPPDQITYSLRKLVTLMGGKWPDGMPDFAVSNFTCSTKNDTLDIWVDMDISNLPYETEQIAANVKSMYFNRKAKVNLQFNYGLSIGIFGTRLTIILESIKIPISGNNQFGIDKPTLILDINPLFKFVVFTVKGTIPFNLFGKQFDTTISMVIDNVEAEVGVDVEGDNSSLPVPSVMRGVHFDQFGAGLGFFFTPPGYALGIQGKYHIGDPSGGNVVALNDDTFALVCKIDGEIPEPVYISFYVPQMDINKVVEIFTNSSPNLDVPVTFKDLSFRWSENPMEPYTLPDGTLSQMGYGFSAAVDIFSFGFYGDVEVDMNNGLTANLEMSPVSLGPVFKLSGDGKGFSLKVDQNGNPIRNNQIRDKKVLQDALAKATDKQIVAPGGPVLIMNTFKLPFLHVNAQVSFLELKNYSITADIDGNGIFFTLDFGGILTEQMSCALSDYHNLCCAFKFGIDHNFSLPTIEGVSLGSVHVKSICEALINIQTSLSDVVFKIWGSFTFRNLTREFSEFYADIHIQKMSDVIEAIISNITGNAERIFDDVIHNAALWAAEAKEGLIVAYDTISNVLKTAYHKTADEVATIMKGAGFAADQVASEIKGTFNLGVDAVESAMKSAGYAANEVIDALKNVFSINEIASALKNVYGMSVNDINSFLQSAGYTADQVKNAFESLGGDFANFAKDTWNKISNPDTWNPSKW